MIRTEEIMRRVNEFIEEMEKLGVKVKVTVTFDVRDYMSETSAKSRAL